MVSDCTFSSRATGEARHNDSSCELAARPAQTGEYMPDDKSWLSQKQTVMEDSGVVLLDFRALLEAAPDGIAVVDGRGRILVVNDQLCSLFGYTPNELTAQPVETLVPSRFRVGHTGHRRGYASRPSRRPMGLGMDLVGQRKDGTEFPVEISLSPVKSNGHSFTIAVVRDISDQLLRRREQEALRTILDTEQERHRIGMDLHDGIMQDVFAVALGLDLAFEDIDVDPKQAKEAVGRSIDQLHDVIRDIRSYIFELRPRQFHGELRQALIELGQEFQQNSSIQTEVVAPSDLPAIDHQVGITLYVIAHEALSNARKYAQAGRVEISLEAHDGILSLEIRDDGSGFDTTTEMSESHRGLRNMANRASIVGADLRIASEPGCGTAIHVEVGLDGP